MKIIYAGTPEFAVPALEALIQSRHRVVAVYTQPDRPAGRGQKIRFSPVKEAALQHDLNVVQAVSLKDEYEINRLRSFQADLMIVAAYGIILPAPVLRSPALGCINIHASLLPRWRGAAPIQRAILSGDEYTGITLMQMDEGLDTGDMLATARVKIKPHMTAAELHDQLKFLGASLLLEQLDSIANGNLAGQPQNDAEASYAAKLHKQEARLDWSKAALLLDREIRAYNPWPVSFTTLSGQNIKVWSAHTKDQSCSARPGRVLSHTRDGIEVCCGDGVLSLTGLQVAGKKRTSADQLLNSRNLTDECFGD